MATVPATVRTPGGSPVVRALHTLGRRATRSRGHGCHSPAYVDLVRETLRTIRQYGPVPGLSTRLKRHEQRQLQHCLEVIDAQLAHGLVMAGLRTALRGLEVAPNNLVLLTAAGQALLSLGGAQAAARFFYQALWVNPQYEPARNGLYAIAEIDFSELRSEFFDLGGTPAS